MKNEREAGGAPSAEYEIENGVLKKYNGNASEVVVPDGVTEIGGYAFRDRTEITGVKLPCGIKKIGYSAFWNCVSLKEIIIPESVTALDEFAFAWCKSLKSIVIPDGVTEIGDYAFGWCDSLSSVTVPCGVKRWGNCLFYECNNLRYNEYGNALYLGNEANKYFLLYKAKNPEITSCEIHESAKKIYYEAFEYCKSLASVTMTEGVTHIFKKAFIGCKNLKSVIIPQSMAYVGKDAFRDCESLTIYYRAERPTVGWDTNWNRKDKYDLVNGWHKVVRGYKGN